MWDGRRALALHEPRPHLKTTHFVVHSHNLSAACLMVLQLQSLGYDVEVLPFGEVALKSAGRGRLGSLLGRAIRWLLAGGQRPALPSEAQQRQGPAGRSAIKRDRARQSVTHVAAPIYRSQAQRTCSRALGR